MTDFRTHVRRAIQHHGSQAKLAKEADCSQQYISWLLTSAEQISGEMAVAFEKATGGTVNRHDFRPDLFPSPSTEAASA